MQNDFQPIDLLSDSEVERKSKNKLYTADVGHLKGLFFKLMTKHIISCFKEESLLMQLNLRYL